MGPVLSMSMQTKATKRWIDRAIITVMAVLGVFMLLPFAWLFSMSFRPPAEAYKMPPSFLPPTLDFKNYWAVLNSSVPFLQIYWNSVQVAVLVSLGQLVTCTLAAFAFARLTFPGRDSIFFVMLVGLMFPAQVTIIPIYLGFAQVGLLNRPIGLVLMYLTSSFGVFLVRQFMRSQPKALEEAALMDGAGYFKIFYRISLPQLRPALSALGIITFTQTWNYYFQARVLLEPQQAMTLPVAMDLLRGYLASGNLSVVMAAMSMAVLPVILIFLLAQRLVIEGVTMSGIKN
jgi:multiple sugar transport system permease protein